MIVRRLIPTPVIAALVFAPASAAFAQSEHAAPHCAPVEGAGMTNLAVINQATTLGTQTGDLAGAVSAVILSVTPGANGTTVFKVQHHFVTETGNTITAAPAIGEIFLPNFPDLAGGETVFRYSGQLCYAAPGRR